MIHNYYTLQIRYTTPGQTTIATEERKDLFSENPAAEKEWRRKIRESLFTNGFEVYQSPSCIEFVAPYRIVSVLLIRQDKKYSV